MVYRKMVEISVATTTEGMIEIAQGTSDPDDTQLIEIAPDQVDILVQWLIEAKKELTKPDP